MQFDKKDTVQSLKDMIQDQIGAPVDSQTLLFGEKILDNDMTLENYGISDDVTLNLKLPNRGGASPDSKTAENELLYWQVSEGLNYGGRCSNKECKAENQRIMMNRGFGEFRPNEDAFVEEVVRCPGCKATFEPKGYYFYRCQVEVTFKKSGDKSPTRLPCKNVDGDDYWKFGEDEEEANSFQSLIFNVKKLKS